MISKICSAEEEVERAKYSKLIWSMLTFLEALYNCSYSFLQLMVSL